VVSLLFVYAAVRLFWTVEAANWVDTAAIEGVLKVAIWVVPTFLVAALLDFASRTRVRPRWPLGLQDAPARGIIFGLIATAPMAVVAPFRPHGAITPDVLTGTVLLGPFAEEVLFRGFLFTELRTYARWPLSWAIAVSGMAFGAAHVPNLDVSVAGVLYQLMRQPQMAIATALSLGAAFGVPAMAGAVFAWVFHRSRTLWPAIGLHACLNLWWTVSRPEQTRIVLRPDLAGAAQMLSMALAIVLAETWRQQRTATLEVRRL
jgi:membrane protease YdiL (CAAX protease family)